MGRLVLKRVLCEIIGRKENGKFKYLELGDTDIILEKGNPITFYKNGFLEKTGDVITNFTDSEDSVYSSVTLNDEKYIIIEYPTIVY